MVGLAGQAVAEAEYSPVAFRSVPDEGSVLDVRCEIDHILKSGRLTAVRSVLHPEQAVETVAGLVARKLDPGDGGEGELGDSKFAVFLPFIVFKAEPEIFGCGGRDRVGPLRRGLIGKIDALEIDSVVAVLEFLCVDVRIRVLPEFGDHHGLDGLRLGELVLDPALAVLVGFHVEVISYAVAGDPFEHFLACGIATA